MKSQLKKFSYFLLIAVLSVSLTGCIGPFSRKTQGTKDATQSSEVINQPVDARLDALKKTEVWYKAIEAIRITAATAETFADAALTAGKISQVERDAVYGIVRNLIKPGLRVANSELLLYFQNATTDLAVEQKIADVRVAAAQLDALTTNLKGRQFYDHVPGEAQPAALVKQTDAASPAPVVTTTAAPAPAGGTK